MNVDDRIRAALQFEVRDMEPTADALSQIRRRSAGRPRRGLMAGAAAVAAAAVAAILVPLSLSDDGAQVFAEDTNVAGLPPAEHRAVAVHGDELHVLDDRTGEIVREHRLSDVAEIELRGFAEDKSGVLVRMRLGADRDTKGIIIDLDTGKRAPAPHDADFLALSPDGRTMAIVPHDSSGNHEIVLRDLDSGVERSLGLANGTFSELNRIERVVWSPDSRRLAYVQGYYGYNTFVVDASTATSLEDAPLLIEQVAAMAWLPDGVLVGSYFCCAEREPPQKGSFREGGETVDGPTPFPDGASSTDVDDETGKWAEVLLDATGENPTLHGVGQGKLAGYSQVVV